MTADEPAFAGILLCRFHLFFLLARTPCTDSGTCPCDDGTNAQTDSACESVTCTDETGTYEVGESWACPDGCNTCGCTADGEIAATKMDCG
ncbi:MAG: hypothetical protein EXR69_01405 [Myxococcales bacterium]|nr:hypothetical protein [Myxococcales bacterium]